MAEQYRDRQGRFTTRALWEELFAPHEEFQYVEEEEPEDVPEPNWIETNMPYSQIWSSQWYNEETGKPEGDVEPLDLAALEHAEFPEGFEAYKAIYSVLDNPSYPRGYKTSEPYHKYQEWPPPSAESQGAKKLIAIRFF